MTTTTFTIRLSEEQRAGLEALVKARKRGLPDGATLTVASLIRALIEDAIQGSTVKSLEHSAARCNTKSTAKLSAVQKLKEKRGGSLTKPKSSGVKKKPKSYRTSSGIDTRLRESDDDDFDPEAHVWFAGPAEEEAHKERCRRYYERHPDRLPT